MNRKLKLEELGRASVEEFKTTRKLPLVLVLDNIRSGHNVGSVFRTSDAYLVEKIYLCGITAQPPQKDIQKSAIGATESVEWIHHKNTLDCVQKLKDDGYLIISVEQAENSVSFEDINIDPNTKVCLVLGNEVKGVDQKVIDISEHCLELPQFGTKHSLNISVCAGIVIWEFQKKMRNNSTS